MTVGKAMAFGLFAMFPGALLSLIAWIVIGKPDTWSGWMSIPCYGPFFGSIAIGIWLGVRKEQGVEMEP